MRVEILVARNRFPVVGQIIDIPEKDAQYLIDSGLAKKAGGKVTKKAVIKPTETETEGK